MNKTIYITFMVKPTKYVLENTNIKTRKYAVKCPNEDKAFLVAKDLLSMDGITYARANYCGRLQKDVQVIDYEAYWDMPKDF